MFRSYEFLFSKDFVEGSVALSNRSDESTNCNDVRLSQIDCSVFIEVANIELDWRVVLRSDQPICVVALSGQVEICQFVIKIDVALHFGFDVSLSSLFHLIQIMAIEYYYIFINFFLINPIYITIWI